MLAFLMLCGPLAHAGGFQISDQSARSMAMGGGSVALTDDPMAMTVNPAVLPFLPGTNFVLGATVIVPTYRFTGVTPADGSTKMQPQALSNPALALTFSPGTSISFGVAAHIPFAIKTAWSQDWVGRRITTSTELRTVFISPAIAFQPNASLSIGFGMNIVASNVLLSRRLGFDSLSQPDGFVTYEGNSRFDYGFQVGIQYRPAAFLSIGLGYQSKVNVDIGDGTATFGDIPPQLAASYPNSEARTTLSTPDVFRGGIMLHLGRTVMLLGELEYVLWSQYESLSITFKDPALRNVVLPESWSDSWTGRIGIELTFPGITVRGGIIFDPTPIPDATVRPTVADAKKVGYCAGIGYAVAGALQLDFAVAQYPFADRVVTNSTVEYLPGQYFNGTYGGSMTTIGLTLSYNWN